MLKEYDHFTLIQAATLSCASVLQGKAVIRHLGSDGSPCSGESWRAPSPGCARSPAFGEDLNDRVRHRSAGMELGQDASVLRDVSRTRRRAAVNQRPAGSWEGYVWLPRWISSTNYLQFVLLVHLDPRQIESTNSVFQAVVADKLARMISVDQFTLMRSTTNIARRFGHLALSLVRDGLDDPPALPRERSSEVGPE